ncbi:MAG: hypothetical protein LBI10_11260 [Deltaproteobacteria bacterium]|jgi:hypothetical protein|nr:hypothetical protein [Deltaproteobacteria bacterium]
MSLLTQKPNPLKVAPRALGGQNPQVAQKFLIAPRALMAKNPLISIIYLISKIFLVAKIRLVSIIPLVASGDLISKRLLAFKGPRGQLFSFASQFLGLLGLMALGVLGSPLNLAAESPRPKIIPVARPNPYDRGTCYQWKGCRGESIGAMPVDDPKFCGPLGGKSWRDFDGRCLDLNEGPRSAEPPEEGKPAR